ncbi:helix-turn-helix domain-containing protein [Flavobacterium sp. TBRC 19031]|uniref:helix-turn-helix domain-containing protein n=1 Tax=Flavobacterium mekongense TaxID=3379707 RepID=UPI00399B6CCA
MKKESIISDLLGLNQREAARLLQVSRSQLSMYELGQRDLPLSAKVLLTAMVDQAQQRKSAPTVLPLLAQQEQLKQHWIERQLKLNTFRQLRMSRILTKMEQTYAAQLKILELVAQLKEANADDSKVYQGFLKSLENKAHKKMTQTGLAQLLQCQIKLATLQAEAKILNEAMEISK